jgi:hypothetical protein
MLNCTFLKVVNVSFAVIVHTISPDGFIKFTRFTGLTPPLPVHTVDRLIERG